MKRSTSAAQREMQWRERIAGQSKSGQSIAAWCREHGIAVQSFYGWKSRLAQGKAKSMRPLPKVAGTSFIDLGTVREAMPCAGLEIRLDLGNGMMLSIARR